MVELSSKLTQGLRNGLADLDSKSRWLWTSCPFTTRPWCIWNRTGRVKFRMLVVDARLFGGMGQYMTASSSSALARKPVPSRRFVRFSAASTRDSIEWAGQKSGHRVERSAKQTGDGVRVHRSNCSSIPKCISLFLSVLAVHVTTSLVVDHRRIRRFLLSASKKN